ncbi:MAG: endonuclease domain-containing protein [Alphaproteobacteria bacterium]|nr:endonuclease domain-containing protein [Alphaproteobacteria bacterium]
MAKRLRKQQTDAEKLLWSKIRNRLLANAKFRRQWPIGNLVAEFVCVEAKLIVELDGGQHAESKHDSTRTSILEKLGYRVVRYWNNDVMQNIDGVLESLLKHLGR